MILVVSWGGVVDEAGGPGGVASKGVADQYLVNL